MEKFTTFCRIEKELFNDLVSNKNSVRYNAKRELFLSAYNEFVRLFSVSGMTWEQYSKVLVLTYTID